MVRAGRELRAPTRAAPRGPDARAHLVARLPHYGARKRVLVAVTLPTGLTGGRREGGDEESLLELCIKVSVSRLISPYLSCLFLSL